MELKTIVMKIRIIMALLDLKTAILDRNENKKKDNTENEKY